MSSKNSRKAPRRTPAACDEPHSASPPAARRAQLAIAWASRWDRAAGYAAYAVMLLAVFTGLAYVYAFGVNLYWWDDWPTLPVLFEHYDAGTLSPADFWELHNEHRVLFPKLVMFGLGLLTRGDAVANMYFSQLLLAAILATYVIAFRRQFPGGWATWLMAPMAFLVFSWRQTENMLWGFQVGFVMVMAAALAAFLCLSRLSNQRYGPMFVGAVAAATVAAFSSIHGLLVWPVGLGQLFVVSLSRRLKVMLATVWAGIAAIEWLAFFQGWEKPPSHPAWGFAWEFLPTLVGGALWSSRRLAFAGGIVLLLAAAGAVVLVFACRQWAAQSFWLATMAFALATLGAITMGRCGYGVDYALASRYATFSIPIVIASYAIFVVQGRQRRHPATIAAAAVLLIMAVAGTAFSLSPGLTLGRSGREFRQYQQFMVATMDQQPGEIAGLVRVFPGDRTGVVRHAAAVLKKLKYNVFADEELCARYTTPDPSVRGAFCHHALRHRRCPRFARTRHGASLRLGHRQRGRRRRRGRGGGIGRPHLSRLLREAE